MTEAEYLGKYKVQTLGSTCMITIPIAYVRALNLVGGTNGDTMKIYRKGKKLIIEKVGENDGEG